MAPLRTSVGRTDRSPRERAHGQVRVPEGLGPGSTLLLTRPEGVEQWLGREARKGRKPIFNGAKKRKLQYLQ